MLNCAAHAAAPVAVAQRRGSHGGVVRLLLSVLGALWILSLSGCGGGGGGSKEQGTVVATTAAEYWASGTEARWTYRRSDGRGRSTPSVITKTVVDAGAAVVGGRSVRRFEHSWGTTDDAAETEYRWLDNGAASGSIRRVEPFSLDENTASDEVAYDELQAPLTTGITRSQTLYDQAIDLDGDLQPDRVLIELKSTQSLLDSLTVPAGDFRRVLQSRLELVVTVAASSTGRSASVSESLTTWYAPQVGVIRREYVDSAYAAPTNSVVEELIGFDVAGLRAGLVTGTSVLGDIGFGTDSGTVPSLASAVGRSGMLVAAVSATGSVEAQWIGPDGRPGWRARVLTPPEGFLYNSVAVAHDGSGYRVVAARNEPANSPSTHVVDGVTLDESTGAVRAAQSGLDLAVPSNQQSLGFLQLQAHPGDGSVMLLWGRYDSSYIEISPGLVMPVGWTGEARRFAADWAPVTARQVLGAGEPMALAWSSSLGQYLVVSQSQARLYGRALAADGSVLGDVPRLLASTAGDKGDVQLQEQAGAVWLSWMDVAAGGLGGSQRAARLGAGAVLRDGDAAAPGWALGSLSGSVSSVRLVPGSSQALQAGSEGWNDLWAVSGDLAQLPGGAAWPTASTSIGVAQPPGGSTTNPSRQLRWSGTLGDVLLLGWVDNEQQAGTPSDRLGYALMYPRYLAP